MIDMLVFWTINIKKEAYIMITNEVEFARSMVI